MTNSSKFRRIVALRRGFPIILARPPRDLHLIAFFVIVGAAILLRSIFFQGYVNSDPSFYAILANDLAQGIVHVLNYDSAPNFHVRFGTFAPVAVFIRLFGLSEVTLSIYPFLASIVSVLLVYALSRHLFNPLAALISMAMLAVLPIDIEMSSTLYPDPIAAAWANAGMVLLIIGLNKDSNHCAALAILAGLCFGIAWLCKESIIYLAPFVMSYLFFARQQEFPWNIIWVGLGSTSVIVSEGILYQINAGDFLYHLHQMKINEQQDSTFFFGEKSVYFGWAEVGYARALAKRLLLSGPSHLLRSFSALPAFAMIALAWAAIVWDRRFLIPGVWFATLMAMFNFGSMSFESYKPLPVSPERYFYLLITPAVLLLSGFLATLLKSGAEWNLRRERRFWAGVTGVAFSVICIQGMWGLRERPEQMAVDAAGQLSPSDLVYTDYRTAASLVFFRTGLLLTSDKNTAPYENLATDDMRSGAYVLLNKPMTEFLTKSYGYSAPAFVNIPPKAWKEVWKENGATLFRIN